MITIQKNLKRLLYIALSTSWLSAVAEAPQLVLTTINNKTGKTITAKDYHYNELFTIKPGLNTLNKSIQTTTAIVGGYFAEFDTGIAFLIDNLEYLFLSFDVYSRTWHHSIYRDQVIAHLHALGEYNIDKIGVKKIWRSPATATAEQYFISLTLEGAGLEKSRIESLKGN